MAMRDAEDRGRDRHFRAPKTRGRGVAVSENTRVDGKPTGPLEVKADSGTGVCKLQDAECRSSNTDPAGNTGGTWGDTRRRVRPAERRWARVSKTRTSGVC